MIQTCKNIEKSHDVHLIIIDLKYLAFLDLNTSWFNFANSFSSLDSEAKNLIVVLFVMISEYNTHKLLSKVFALSWYGWI